MFLLGGTAFSGKTLLAHMLTQRNLVCLDEPDFHNVAQRHRGIPELRKLFPEKSFPQTPDRSLDIDEAVKFLEQCEAVIHPVNLGMKTAGSTFVEYAPIYRRSGYPVIALIRDIRDVLAEGPLPDWIPGQRELSAEFRLVWENLNLCDAWFRYEELVTSTDSVIRKISALLGNEIDTRNVWTPASVSDTMLKLERHDMLRAGSISSGQVGIWRPANIQFDDEVHATAIMMGYDQ